ncbi:MAG TPA: PAS domain S-box protein [Burkholderiales bacterium]|nr:PAS domain S-box protein [Burkholderiales bacterium]
MPAEAPLAEALIFADRDGVIRDWNAGAHALFGHAPEEAIGRSLDLIIPEHLRAAHWRGYRDAIATGRTRSSGKPLLTRAVHKDGGKLYVEFAFRIVRDASGAVLGAEATAHPATKP